MKLQSYRELEVWKKAITFVTVIYAITNTFPKSELYSLTNQIRRASVSIPSNIAEGWGRYLTKQYIFFLRVSRGSLLELETQLIIARNLKYIEQSTLDDLLSQTEELNKMLNAMIRKLGQR
jgi:four helix bundle protein